MRWLKLIIPPEWDLWAIRDRVVYLALLIPILCLVGIGARVVAVFVVDGAIRLIGGRS